MFDQRIRPAIDPVVQLPVMPKLKDIHPGLAANKKADLRRENRETLQAEAKEIYADSVVIAPKVTILERKDCPQVQFAVAFNKEKQLLVLAARCQGSRDIVYGVIPASEPRGNQQDLSMQDLQAMALLREQMLVQYGSRLGVN